MSRKRWPADCPVFKVEGEAVEVRPRLSLHREDSDLVRHTGNGLSMVFDDGCYAGLLEHYPRAKPMTRAARTLLKWSRQS